MKFNYKWPLPGNPNPIVIIGAGGIINDAHMPAYKKAGFEVLGVYDIDTTRSQETAKKWGIQNYKTLKELINHGFKSSAVFDLAIPPSSIQEILKQIPKKSSVLIQKPMGSDLKDARGIRNICRRNKLTAAINFQLRFSPMMMILRDALDQNLIGKILDVDINLNLMTPWNLFPFLKKMSRVEIAVHSIHYLDLIRSFLGNPSGIWAQTLGHPASKKYAQTRTSAILNYGPEVRCCLSINHNYFKGPNFQSAQILIDGSEGGAMIKLGLLLNYPKGEPDEVWLHLKGNSSWKKANFEGGWFPDAFIGTMSNLQRYDAGEDKILQTSVEDAYYTMALVEGCYNSNLSGGTKLPR